MNYAKQITQLLVITLVLSLGFGQLLRFETGFGVFYLHDVLVVAVISLHIKNLFLQFRSIIYNLRFLLLGLSLGFIRALTLYQPIMLITPSLYALRLLAYLALYFVLKYQKIKIPKKIFLISGAISLIIGLSQYFLMPDMRVFQYLGWDDHLNRLTLPHFDPTFSGVMLSMYLLLLFPYKIQNTKYIIPNAIGILLTYSRSVWLSLFLTLTIFTKQKKKFLLLASCILFLAIFMLPKKFGEGTNLLRTYSIVSRFNEDLSYIKQYGWDLVIGRGMNTLILDKPISTYPNHATTPNNSYLYLLVTTGVLGLIGWGTFLKKLYINSRYKPLIVFVLIASLFNNVMFYPFVLLLLLLSSFVL